MIDKETSEILYKEKERLLEEKSKLGFFKRLFFRKYTDWILTGNIVTYKSQEYDITSGFKEPVGNPKYTQYQESYRMRLKDGSVKRSLNY